MKELKQLKRHLLKQYPTAHITIQAYRDHVGQKRARIDTTLDQSVLETQESLTTKQRLVQANIDKFLIKTLNRQRLPFYYREQG